MTRAAPVSFAGLVALAVAMGIGRFAFTPILPMMLDDGGITLAQGGWLASANYAGYLAGALFAMRSPMRAQLAIRAGLVLISASTALAALSPGFAALLVLRFVPGFASALVLVYVSAWSLEILALEGRQRLGGVVFAGVGVGIVYAGLACLALSQRHASATLAWAALGGSAFVAMALIWPVVRTDVHAARTAPRSPEPDHGLWTHWRLVYAHGAFGFGYIIPATFLPVMARQVIADTAVFGWAWPVFGAAAAISTLVSGWLTAHYAPRRIWAFGLFVMAVGVVIPVFVNGIAGIIASALAVGGTFMVVTMVGIQEARREAGESAKTLIAAMTASFAAGQIAGPFLVSALAHVERGFAYALFVAAAPLVLGTYFLRDRKGVSETTTPQGASSG